MSAGAPGGLHADAVRLLDGWTPPDAAQGALRAAYLSFLSGNRHGTHRHGGPAHLTASTLVVDPGAGRALLTLHAKGGFWAQTGGHCEEADATLAGAALREAVEESGIAGLRLLDPDDPVDLDRHALGGAFGPCREHLDVRWVALAPPGAEPVRSAESRALRWFALDALADGAQGPVGGGAVLDLQRLAGAARARLSGLPRPARPAPSG